MTTFALAPLFAASFLIQLHALAGGLALLVGLVRLLWFLSDRVAALFDWIFLALLSATAISGFLLPTPDGAANLWGVTTHHVLAVIALLGTGAAILAAHHGDALGRRRIASATFGGVLVVAGLFEVIPGRLLNTVLAGG